MNSWMLMAMNYGEYIELFQSGFPKQEIIWGGPGGPPIGPPCNEIGMGGPGVTMGGPWGGLKKKHGGAWGGLQENGQCGKRWHSTCHTYNSRAS